MNEQEYMKQLILERQIEDLRTNLLNTDYIACKIAEGSATVEEYADVIEQRRVWRDEINKLEEMIK
jgi:hypothetical protein